VAVVAACSGDNASTSASTSSAARTTGGTVTLAITNPFTSYNVSSVDGNGTSNLDVVNAVQPWVVKFDDQANVVVNTDLATVTKTSDRPLVVEYAFNPRAVWSDGQPVGCDDVYLAWVAQNGVAKDAGTGDQLFHSAAVTGWDQIAGVACSAGGKTATVSYAAPFSDWKSLVSNLMPARVVATHAGLSSAAGIRTAYEAGDLATLKKVADFWNAGFNTETGFDPAVELSAGPYRISRVDPDQGVTLVRNERYWGPPGRLDSIVFRVVTSEGTAAQALANREVNVIGVSGTDSDAIGRLKSLDGVTVFVAPGYTFEHIDFNFQFPLFQDKAVRQAVAACIPRQEILDKLVKPVQADAVLLENRMFFPNQTGYTDTSGGRYDRVDVAAAKAALGADGWRLDGGVYVKNGQRLEFDLLHKNIAPRSAIAQLVQASCAAAGIAVVDDGDPNWPDRAGHGSFEAVDFSWTGSPQLSQQRSTYHTPPSHEDLASNFGSYSNPEVDALLDVLATETDEAKLAEAANRADTLLWNDVATVPLYQHPSIGAWTQNVHGVRLNPTYQGTTWNIETWTVS
jgi:peptide/nickel transport system substrate-binding protein